MSDTQFSSPGWAMSDTQILFFREWAMIGYPVLFFREWAMIGYPVLFSGVSNVGYPVLFFRGEQCRIPSSLLRDASRHSNAFSLISR